MAAALASVSTSLASLSMNSPGANVCSSSSSSMKRVACVPQNCHSPQQNRLQIFCLSCRILSHNLRMGVSRVMVSMALEAGVSLMGTKVGVMTYFTPEGNAIPSQSLGSTREIPLGRTSIAIYQPSQKWKLDQLFKEGALIDMASDSIGKGFAGGIKRWHFLTT
ncbi:hypothetical protein R1sor_022319 [Riccia sorocarpa]|uniref:Large ribosomal subunit protein uL3c n=1 Tax=Riccia sorocarpa TaxID=122646 RepID=A0ABD3GJI5_9MARC